MKINISISFKNHIIIHSDKKLNVNPLIKADCVESLYKNTDYVTDIWIKPEYTYNWVISEIKEYFDAQYENIEWTIEPVEILIKEVDKNNLTVKTNFLIDWSSVKDIAWINQFKLEGNTANIFFVGKDFEYIKELIEKNITTDFK